MRKLGKALCWVLAAAIVLAVFGSAMVWVTGWLFNVILDGAHGWKDTLGRVIGALIAAPLAGVAAGATCAFVVGAPLVLLLKKMGVDDPLRRRSNRRNGPAPGRAG